MSRAIDHRVVWAVIPHTEAQETYNLNQISREEGGRWTLRAVVDDPAVGHRRYYFTRGVKE